MLKSKSVVTILAGIMALAGCAATSGSSAPRALAASPYIEYLDGDFPVILEVPHDGTMVVEGGRKRDVVTGGRDTHVAELVRETRRAMQRLAGTAPASIALLASRQYVDANRRAAPDAWADAAGEAVHHAYDRTIDMAIERIRKKHGSGLLVSFHSGYNFDLDAYVGVNHKAGWSTIPGFVRRHGWDRFQGPDGIAGRLAARGYLVPGFGGLPAHGGWAGDVIIRHCRYNNRGVDGLQFEFSGKRLLFNQEKRIKLAEDLARIIVDFTKKYYME